MRKEIERNLEKSSRRMRYGYRGSSLARFSRAKPSRRTTTLTLRSARHLPNGQYYTPREGEQSALSIIRTLSRPDKRCNLELPPSRFPKRLCNDCFSAAKSAKSATFQQLRAADSRNSNASTPAVASVAAPGSRATVRAQCAKP